MTQDTDRPVRRMLVLSASGGFGAGLTSPDAHPWPELVHRSLQDRVGEVDLVLRRFYVHSGNPLEFLNRELERGTADFIVLQCTSFPATQKTVANKVESMFGRRAGHWTEARVQAFDHQTRRRGQIRSSLNTAGHRAGQRIIGTAPMIGVQPLIARYKQAIDRVAMVEAASIVVFGTGFASDQSRQNNPEVEAIKHAFNTSIADSVRRKHLAWVDAAAITANSPNPEAMFADMLHKTQAWHTELGEQIAEALLASYQSFQS